jgi:hypothetical protein
MVFLNHFVDFSHHESYFSQVHCLLCPKKSVIMQPNKKLHEGFNYRICFYY